jgi:hypothetical protein
MSLALVRTCSIAFCVLEVFVRLNRLALLIAGLILIPAAARAQDFGIMESAETINHRNFKIRANPMFLLGRNGGDDDPGLAVLAGYGFTPRFDLEGGVAIYDGVTFFGVNAEYWLVKRAPLDVSVAGGLHRRTGDATSAYNGIDLTLLASGRATPRLDIYGGLDLAFEGIGVPGEFKTAHLVPGLEYKVNDRIDLVAEAGLALNDNSRHYVSGGIAIYFR